MVTQKDLEAMRKTIAEFRQSKYTEINGRVNLAEFEIELNNQTVSFINTHLLCSKDIADVLIEEINRKTTPLVNKLKNR